MDTWFCLAALEDALRKARPQIFNTEQGAQFTSAAFTDMLETAGMIRIRAKGAAFTLRTHPCGPETRVHRLRAVDKLPLQHIAVGSRSKPPRTAAPLIAAVV
jgi:hypothetical protein